ncbi:hypothetical protein CY658_05050 [Variovorax sp. RO1]|uniref:hypothetical protein n=1 Tax=Variovorax sp. RO1 TaxID=2066034 RepID=UPI000C717918|nr:hypothetical protein [Variovorax sp. RO1]PLC06404.1 hypothetical protein CY658_05050 [Variovorax sp. RO1]
MPLVTTGYRFGYGGYYKDSDGSGPYSIDSAGTATLIGGAAGGGGAATIADGADVATGAKADAAAANPAASASVIAILKGIWTSLIGLLTVNTLAQPAVARQLAVAASSGASANTALTTTCRRISIYARGADVRYATRQATDKSGASTVEAGSKVIAKFEAGPDIYIVNNLPYGPRLEYEGYSKQAPAGMVRITVAEYQGLIAKALGEVQK